MASKSSRQRKLERARAERRLARQAHRTRRKRQLQAGVGASLALVLIIFGTVWLMGGFDSEPAETAAPGTCSWTPIDPATNPDAVDTGTPPAGELRSGFETLTIKTSLGDIEALLDLSKIPCTAASFKYLGEKKYFDGSKCHRLNTDAKTLTCGDPKGTGAGSPSYSFADENLPTEPLPDASPASPSPTTSAPSSPSPTGSPAATGTYYAKGTIVMVNTGANTNGGQFSIVYGDASNLTGAYSIVGTVSKGLDLVENVAKPGAVDPDGKPAAEGKPTTDMIIQQLTVGPPPGAPTDSPSAPASSTPAETTSAPAGGQS